MQRPVFDALLNVAGGHDMLWDMFERERSTSAREAEAWTREAEAWTREREALTAAAEARAELARMGASELQHQLDLAHGHLALRAVLEQIVFKHASERAGATHWLEAPKKCSATQALEAFCREAGFLRYLERVGKHTHFAPMDLLKCSKAMYGDLSEAVHHGGASEEGAGALIVPQSIMANKCKLIALSAIFRYGGRDVRFYLRSAREVALELPLVDSTPPPCSTAASTPTTPPKDAVGAAAALPAALLVGGEGGGAGQRSDK